MTKRCDKDDKWCKIRDDKQWGTKGPTTAKKVAKELDKIPHETYVEPFLGKGNVYRAKNHHAKKEILNDLDCGHVKEAKQKNSKRQSFKDAVVTCGKDYKQFLKRHDSRSTLYYLDPPYMKSDMSEDKSLTFKHKNVDLDEIIEKTKNLEGAVAISYADKPEFRKVLCKKPFRCKTIPKQLFNHKYSEILAIKKSGSH